MISRARFSGRRLVLSLLVGLLLAAAARGQTPPPFDFDLDGVADDVDECEETPPGDLIDATGCSLCPCEETFDEEPWESHDAYVQCVMGEAKRMRKARLLTRKAKRAAVKRARRSTCGNEVMTRCCVYPDYAPDAESVTGSCRIMTVDECFDLGDRLDAEDTGAGSCNPNPCVYVF
jgi:hypothetical protein